MLDTIMGRKPRRSSLLREGDASANKVLDQVSTGGNICQSMVPVACEDVKPVISSDSSWVRSLSVALKTGRSMLSLLRPRRESTLTFPFARLETTWLKIPLRSF